MFSSQTFCPRLSLCLHLPFSITCICPWVNTPHSPRDSSHRLTNQPTFEASAGMKCSRWVWGWRMRVYQDWCWLSCSWTQADYCLRYKSFCIGICIGILVLLFFQWIVPAKGQFSWVAVSPKAINSKRELRKMSPIPISIVPQCQQNLPTENELHLYGCYGSSGQDCCLIKQMVGFLDISFVL